MSMNVILRANVCSVHVGPLGTGTLMRTHSIFIKYCAVAEIVDIYATRFFLFVTLAF